ncbi:DUF2652 domain-containing protein [Hyphobacterium sp. CCMP332]|nr:DUF2652 domain-containing protein [Hyphobacterium sp. CCMP332]
MSDQEKSIVFIPDISGFSHFVNSTAISHSEHIISELLELIIEQNSLGMEVSEVEGDAVLFYKEKQVPEFQQLIEQAEQMYIAFHAHLLQYEKYRICTCGACTSASKLSLKFVAHSGELGFLNIQGKKKPHGNNIVIPHRLLKNNISSSSYVLLSESLFTSYQLDENWQKDQYEYEGTGILKYYYRDLNYLNSKIPEPISFNPPDRIDNPIKDSLIINADINNLIEYIANFSFRSIWQKGVDRLEYNPNEVNRLGTSHICVINKKEFQFETVATDISDQHRVIGEKNKNPPFFKELLSYYILDQMEDGVKLSVEIHYFQKNIVSRLMTPILKMILLKNLRNSIKSLKSYAENN